MKKPYFPVYTQVSPEPLVICEKLPKTVFAYPSFNDAVPVVRRMNSKRKEVDLNKKHQVENTQQLALKGFIFHTSHCGSTLLAQMLGASKRNRVVKETEAINGLLLASVFYKFSETESIKFLKKIIEMYLQPLGKAENVVFKLSSWNIFFIAHFQKAFPETPWIFIDRKTEEVVQSLLKSGRGMVDWWHHPTDLLRKHFLGESLKPTTIGEYLKFMVENHKNIAENKQTPKQLWVSYPEFLEEFESNILPHFNMAFSENELNKAIECTHFEAKSFQKIPYSPH